MAKVLDRKTFFEKDVFGLNEYVYLDEGEYSEYEGFIIIPNDERAFNSKEEIDTFLETL